MVEQMRSHTARVVSLSLASLGAVQAASLGLRGLHEGASAPIAARALGSSVVPAAAAPSAREPLRLPEPIAPPALAEALREQPEAHAIVDLRPAWQHAEWSLPGARNVSPDGVAEHLRSLPEAARVVFVDRDGSIAFAVAGAVMNGRTDRAVQVLSGGLQTWHRALLLRTDAAMPAGTAPPARARVPAVPVAPPARKRSAGC